MSLVTIALVGALVAVGLAGLWRRGRRRCGSRRLAPGPSPWPVLGDLPLLRGHAAPYKPFERLRGVYGDVFRLLLGAVPALVVHGADNIRQVLIAKGSAFDSRPNFNRYHRLFQGNKQNSLAFCDWSETQRMRRDLLKPHTFPKTFSNSFQKLNALICEEVTALLDEMTDSCNNNNNNASRGKVEPRRDHPSPLRRLIKNKHVATFVRLPSFNKSQDTTDQQSTDMKKSLSLACGNIFLRYFCSARFSTDDTEFKRFVENFDKIFYEVNQGYVYDFVPALQVLYEKELRKVEKCSEEIRSFVERRLLADRLEQSCASAEADYLDSLLKSVGEDGLDMSTALFSLEDILGGHAAISNFLVKSLTMLVGRSDVQERVRAEVEALRKPPGEGATLGDRARLPYTESIVMEALRLVSSPIVPHVANKDTEIFGYDVPKDTLVLLNNYELNMSSELWTDPAVFEPARFLDASGKKLKPSHFLPFGGGKRSCMGYKLVQFVSVVFLANLLHRFHVLPAPEQDYSTCPIGNLALPTDTFRFRFEPR